MPRHLPIIEPYQRGVFVLPDRGEPDGQQPSLAGDRSGSGATWPALFIVKVTGLSQYFATLPHIQHGRCHHIQLECELVHCSQGYRKRTDSLRCEERSAL